MPTTRTIIGANPTTIQAAINGISGFPTSGMTISQEPVDNIAVVVRIPTNLNQTQIDALDAAIGTNTALGLFQRGDGTFGMPPAASDPWTYVVLGSDFSTGSATAVDVTGLAFTPAASKTYQIRGQFLLRTALATVGPRPGCAWPTGCTDGVVELRTTSAVNTDVLQRGNIAAPVLIPVGGLPLTTGSYPGGIEATMITGSSPSGSFKIQLASETALTNVTMKAGSWIAYRTI